jgi:sugar lactone lactonase YvrE
MGKNPLDGFTVDRASIRYIGHDLQRPECILAEPDGTLWSADARGGVMRIAPDGTQTMITQQSNAQFQSTADFEARFTQGTLPNGLAFAANGDFLIANFGTDALEVMTRDGFAGPDVAHHLDARESLDGRGPAGAGRRLRRRRR